MRSARPRRGSDVVEPLQERREEVDGSDLRVEVLRQHESGGPGPATDVGDEIGHRLEPGEADSSLRGLIAPGSLPLSIQMEVEEELQLVGGRVCVLEGIGHGCGG